MTQTCTVLITGASSGIGYATALAFARAGWNVTGTARRLDRLDALAAAVDALPGDFLPVAADVRDSDALESAVHATVERFGGLDVLVANAGVGQRGSIVDSDWGDIETLLRTNIDGVLHSVRAAVPVMRTGGRGGHVILVSSVVYNMTSPYAAAYAASKAFVSSIGRSLRLELEEDGIRVTDMLIGRTATEFNEKRLGKAGRTGGGIPTMTPEEVAHAILKAVGTRRKAVALRLFDRLLLIGNLIIPTFIGRRAMRQYR